MRRRALISALLSMVAGIVLRAGAAATTIRGRLVPGNGKPQVALENGKRVSLDGDDDTLAVLGDKRIAQYVLELNGHYISESGFRVDPSHTKNLWVIKDGKRLMVTYWCEVCSIRTYTPGKCMCCQQETALDLRDPDAQ